MYSKYGKLESTVQNALTLQLQLAFRRMRLARVRGSGEVAAKTLSNLWHLEGVVKE